MKMFLLGMLVMYLGTSVVALVVGCVTDMFESDFLEIMFMFPFAIIVKIAGPFVRFFRTPKAYIFLLRKGINPWHFKFGQVAELPQEEQEKFIQLLPKKIQKNCRKVLDDFRKI